MVRDPSALAGRAGRGNPDRDQHFLVDERVLDRLPGYLPGPAANVLEIGPGPGALTDRLLAAAGERVTAIERDGELVEFLRTEFAAPVADGRLELIEGDATDVALPPFDACVSNLPYSVSSPVLFRLLPLGRPLVLTVQREFAERMVATAGEDDYGRLSVGAGHYAETEIAEIVPPSAFDPQPAVESAVVVCTPREPAYAVPDDELFLAVVRAIFTQRRKTLRNAIRNTTHISGIEDPEAVLDATDETLLSRRPGTLEPRSFAALARRAAMVGGAGAASAGDADEEADAAVPGGACSAGAPDTPEGTDGAAAEPEGR